MRSDLLLLLLSSLLVASQTSPASDDLYLEGQSSGGFLSDDEDDKNDFSGSGSHEFHPTLVEEEENITRFLDGAATMPQTTGMPQSSDSLATTLEASTVTHQYPEDMQTPELGTRDGMPTETPLASTTDYHTDFSLPSNVRPIVPEDGGWGNNRKQVDTSKDITSEDMWHRTDVLAAVIACGVVGFLCAVFLVLLLAYRMKKKDEGSYVLGLAKVPPSAYLTAPAKEFYA